MSTVARFTDVCVRSAARRWPVSLADLMASEWRAELAHVRRDPQAGRLARTWRQLTFAMSLAMSPAAGSESPITWRARLTGLGPAAQRLATLLGVAMLAYLLPDMAAETWDFATQQNEGHGPVYPMWINTTVTGILSVLALIAMALLGRFVARRLPHAVSRGAVASAAGATMQLGAGFLLTCLIANAGGYNPRNTASTIIASIVLWTFGAAALVAIGARIAGTGRVLLARTVTAIALFVITDVTAFLAHAQTVLHAHLSIASGPLWLPISMIRSGYFPATPNEVVDLVNDAVRADMLPLLLISAFLVAYAVRRRVEVPAVETVAPEAVTVHGPWASRPVRAYALALAVAGLGFWTLVLAFGGLGQDGFLRPSPATDRMVAIACMLFALVIYAAGRGPVTVPTVSAGVLLLVADHVVGGHLWHGPGIAVGLVAFGAAVLIGAARMVPLLAGPGTTGTSARRALIVVAVTAAFTVPTDLPWSRLGERQAGLTSGGSDQPFGVIPTTTLLALTLGFGLLLALTGFVAAVASRREPLSVPGIIVAAIAVGALYAVGTINDDLRSLLYFPQMEFFIQPVIATALVAVARWPRHGRQVRALAWAVVGCAGAAIGAVVLFNALDDVNRLLDGLVPDAFQIGRASLDVIPHFAVGLALALVFAKRLIPPPDPADAGTAPVTLSPATA